MYLNKRNEKEQIEYYTCEIVLESGTKINSNHIIPFFTSLFPNDELKVDISIDGTEPDSFLIKDIDLDILKILDLNDSIEEESETIIKITVIKNIKNTINIYNIDIFIEYLYQLTFSQLLSVFYNYSKTTEKVLINIKNLENAKFTTNLFSTYKSNKEINNVIKERRLENLNLSTNSSGIKKLNFIPEDFKVTEWSENLIPLKKFFDTISNFLSISYISDWSELNDNELQFKILGYKKIDITLPFFQEINNDLECFYNIYRWIYESGNGNIEDKLGLARNIISRSIKYTNEKLYIDPDAYSSIITSYKIYLKENVEKYIETKNKVAELTQEYTIKNREIVTHITNTFRNNSLTLLSYFISLFIFNSLSSKSSTIFTVPTFFVSIALLSISLLYLHLTYKQCKKDLILNIRYFFSIKKIYSDIFDKQELNKIFNKQHLIYNKNNVQRTLDIYVEYWIYEVIILFLLSFFLTFLFK